MTSLVAALDRAAALMDAAGLPYAVVGGAAVVARIRARLTEDVDLLVAMSVAELDTLLSLARARGYDFDPGDRELFEEGLIRLTEAGGLDLDLIRADSPALRQVIERARALVPGGPRFATLEDLVLLKLEAERPIDIDDILAIRDGAGDSLDAAYLRRCARELGLEARLELYFGSIG